MKTFYMKSTESENVELAIVRDFFETTKKSFITHGVEYGDLIYMLTSKKGKYPIAVAGTYVAREEIKAGDNSFWHGESNDATYVERVYVADVRIVDFKSIYEATKMKGSAGSESFAIL